MELNELNKELETKSPQQIISHAYNHLFGDNLVVATSFGIDSAVMLHMATRINPDIRVIFVDTGFLFQETLDYKETLTGHLGLNLRVYTAKQTPDEMIQEYGKLWEQGEERIQQYQTIRKIDPFRTALLDEKVAGIIHGVRSEQTEHRASLGVMERGYDGTFKIHPILKWTKEDVRAYYNKHSLPHHPLYLQGYDSIGDWHSTKPGQGRSGRKLGEHTECGINLDLDYQI